MTEPGGWDNAIIVPAKAWRMPGPITTDACWTRKLPPKSGTRQTPEVMDPRSALRLPGTTRVSSRRLDLDHNLPGRHLLAFRHVDGGHGARNAGRMHMLHLHRLQRHHCLAGRDPVAGFDQHGYHAAVHRRAHLAVPTIARRGRRRRECQVSD